MHSQLRPHRSGHLFHAPTTAIVMPQKSPASQDIRVSVILPVRNGQQHIACALESLTRNCSAEDELIVVDDQSTDATAGIVQAFTPSFSLTMVCGEAHGVAAARNVGLGLAAGRYITFLDHDDYWPDGRIETHVKILENQARTDVVMGTTQVVSNRTHPGFDDSITSIVPLYAVNLGASTFRRGVFDTVGFFDEGLTYSEDQDMFLRLRERGLHIEPLSAVGLYYRLHQTNMTHNKTVSHLQLFSVLRKSLQRRKENLVDSQMSPFPRNRRPLS